MKKQLWISLLAAGVLGVASCGEGTTAGNTEKGDNTDMKHNSTPNADIKAQVLAGKTDPICEMEKDASWTDYSVYKGDSVWFCGEGCKKAFEARPEKYVGN